MFGSNVQELSIIQIRLDIISLNDIHKKKTVIVSVI